MSTRACRTVSRLSAGQSWCSDVQCILSILDAVQPTSMERHLQQWNRWETLRRFAASPETRAIVMRMPRKVLQELLRSGVTGVRLGLQTCQQYYTGRGPSR